jgi:multicomponent K+:H+ antiporter subunit A
MLPFLLATPFLGALACLALSQLRLPKQMPWLITLLTTGVALVQLGLLTWGGDGSRPEFFSEWAPMLGLNFSVWLDGPALFYAWLVLGLGFLIFFYAGFYMDPDDSPWRFYGTMLFFMGAMLGVVTSKNLLLMFVFWELTSISSFILIGHWHEKVSARHGAVRALVVTGGGGLCLLAGLALLGWMGTSAGIPLKDVFELDVLWQNSKLLIGLPLASTVLSFLLLGAFTKSAQFPFHFWLPGAMEAPTPVSAFLHAATMVKAGIYLLGRLYPIFSDMPLWLMLVGTAGVLTMLVGGFMAIMARDLKQLLAHSTVSQLGLLTAYYGFGHGRIGTDAPLPMDLLLVASHAFFKGALFMLVGVIDHSTHTRDWTRLGGLRKYMPVTAVLTIVGCVSMGGAPFTLGFIAKELFLKATLRIDSELPLLRFGLPAIAIVASFFTAAYCYRMAISPFFGKLRDPEIHPHEGGLGLLLSPAILIGLCVLGVWAPLIEYPLAPLVNAPFFGTASGFTLAFFHHIDKLLLIAAVLFSLGVGLFLIASQVEAAYVRAGSPAPFRGTFDRLFDHWIPSGAKALTHAVHQEKLSFNLTIVFGVIFGTILMVMALVGVQPKVSFEWSEISIAVMAALVMTVACLYVVLTHKVLLFRLIAMSPIGLFVVLFFLFYRAPDLALTQLMVEIASLVVFLLLLWRIPQGVRSERAPMHSLTRGVVAALVGLTFAVMSLLAFHSPHRTKPTFEGWPSTRDYYLQNTKYPLMAEGKSEAWGLLPEAREAGYPLGTPARSGGGHNTVNVILVDFRGIDTMGEILVLGVAGLGVLLLMTYHRRRALLSDTAQSRAQIERMDDDLSPAPGLQPVATAPLWKGPSLIVAEVARIVPTGMLIFAGLLYWIGHNQPGGGFIAGLMASVAIILLFMSFRPAQIRKLHDFPYVVLIPFGMFLAIAGGMYPTLFGDPFFTSAFRYFDLGLGGTLGLASPMVFDFGVFLLVVGMTMLIVEKFRKD